MLVKTIKYQIVDPKTGESTPAEEDVYLNLTKAEAIELNIRNDLEVIGRSRNNNEIMDMFRRIIGLSYGHRTTDGKFIKDERQTQIFFASEAYSELFMELWQDPAYAAEFIRGILPAEVSESLDQPENQSKIPEHLRNHPSMQGRRAKETPPSAPTSPVDMLPVETPEQMETRIRFQIAQENASQNTSPAQVSLTPENSQQGNPPLREDLI